MRLPEIPGYQYEDLLGEDPFGWTFVSLYKGKERRVIKVLKAQATESSFLERYFSALAGPESPVVGAAPVFNYTIQESEALAAFAMPFFGWRGRSDQQWQLTSLKRLMHLFTGDQAFDIVKSLAQSLSNTHEADLFHGGLKPGSIFVTGDTEGSQDVLIGDFGQAFMGGLQYLEAGDLLFYTSPEQLASGDFSDGLGFKWDVYAFGVIAFQLLTDHLPRLDRLRQQCLKHPDAMNSASAISYGELTPVSEHFLGQLDKERPVEWPDEADDDRIGALRSIIESCLEFEPESRPDTMVEVAVAISQAWTPKAEVSTVQSEELEPVGDEMAIVEPVIEPDAPAEKGRILAAVRGLFTGAPAKRWKVAAAVSAVLVLVAALFYLGFYALQKRTELQLTRTELSAESAELQANVERQAEAYLQVLSEKKQSSEQLRSELDNVEDSHSRLLGEAKLARQILRQTQENGDEFFRLVLENRDTDVPGFREQRADALFEARTHYERLIEVYGDAPDFIVSTANALFYLGRIYKEMGEFGKALAVFGEAERRYAALLEDSRTADVNFVKNLAIAKQALGQLSIKNGKYSIARHYFTESSRYWTEARAASPADSQIAGISIHENSLYVAECEYSIGRLDAALDATRSIAAMLLKRQEEDPENDRVLGALATSFSLAGRILEAQDSIELAQEAYQQSSDLFAQAVKLNAAIDMYQLGLGNSLARVGLLTDDMEKLEGAVEVLGRVVVHNPFEAVYQKTLADVYGVLARNQRDGGQLESAIALEKEAISVLQPIVRESGLATPPDVLFSYSQRLAHLAELLGDEGDFDESRKPLKEAIMILERISQSDVSVASYRRALARARGLAGFACLKTGDKTEAKEHLELAKSEWESYVLANPEDADAEQAVRWTTDQLRGLQ
tara:strand:- start:740 stop:3451 length:2712 start_codon:yes stop_codon:yes gene_type:complete